MNKGSQIILAVVFVGILVFGASFGTLKVKAQTSDQIPNQTSQEATIAALKALLQTLIQMLNQLLAQRGMPGVNTISTTTTIAPPKICSTLSGKYSMTLREAIELFNNSKCKTLGDPNKLPIRCQQCGSQLDKDPWLLDRAAYRIEGITGECIINIKDKKAYINEGPGFCTGLTDVPNDTSPGSCIYLCQSKGYKIGVCLDYYPDSGYPCDGAIKSVNIGWAKDCPTLAPDPNGRERKTSCCCTNTDPTM